MGAEQWHTVHLRFDAYYGTTVCQNQNESNAVVLTWQDTDGNEASCRRNTPGPSIIPWQLWARQPLPDSRCQPAQHHAPHNVFSSLYVSLAMIWSVLSLAESVRRRWIQNTGDLLSLSLRSPPRSVSFATFTLHNFDTAYPGSSQGPSELHALSFSHWRHRTGWFSTSQLVRWCACSSDDLGCSTYAWDSLLMLLYFIPY